MANDKPVSTQRFEDYVSHHRREHELIAQGFAAQKRSDDFRIERLNELRQDVEKDRGQFQPVVVEDQIRQRIEDRIGHLEQAVAGMKSATATWLVAIGIFFTLVQIALKFID